MCAKALEHLDSQHPEPPYSSQLSACFLQFPVSKGLQFCGVWFPDCQSWCCCWGPSDIQTQPQTLGEKPSPSLCSHDLRSTSHINTGIILIGILSALLVWFVLWKLGKCLCTLLSQALLHLGNLSAQYYGPRVGEAPYGLWLHTVFCCLEQPLWDTVAGWSAKLNAYAHFNMGPWHVRGKDHAIHQPWPLLPLAPSPDLNELLSTLEIGLRNCFTS